MNAKRSALLNAYVWAHRARLLLTTALSGTMIAAQVTPTFAAGTGINNTANAVGTYNSTTSNYGSAAVSVPVTAGTPALTVSMTAGAPTVANGTDTSHTDGLDTILYTYTVTNTGNVTMTNVTPTDTGPTFGTSNITGTGTLGSFSPTPVTLAPGASQVFTATYTLSTVDVYHAADTNNTATNKAGAHGADPSSNSYDIATVNDATATSTINGNPSLNIQKTWTMVDAQGHTATTATVGALVTYTYKVTNVGTVTMLNVKVNDVHEGTAVPVGGSGISNETLSDPGPLLAGASSDNTPNDGNWSSLAPGATVTFTWTHTVTQTEFDHG